MQDRTTPGAGRRLRYANALFWAFLVLGGFTLHAEAFRVVGYYPALSLIHI